MQFPIFAHPNVPPPQSNFTDVQFLCKIEQIPAFGRTLLRRILMKNLCKLLGIVAIGAVIAISGCDNDSADDGGGGGDKIPAELIAQWKIDGGSSDMVFEFTADKLIIPTYSGECEFSISGKHIKVGAKGTPAAYLSDFCTDYTIGSDGKLTLTGSQILGNSTFVKITG
jgi:hypothetical protein